VSLRIFGLWCLVRGHRRDADSRRSENGNVFAACTHCGRELFRDPVRGKWRAATDVDRSPRGFKLTEDRPPAAPRPKKKSHRKSGLFR